jgi:photosystem II stability/assembly factor-like uncharacterized protein
MKPLLKIMKRFAFSLLLLPSFIYAQEGWIWQNPLPQGNDMSCLQFVNSATAYALCYNSVMKTTNTGYNWSIYYTNHDHKNISLQFVNENTGYVVSDSGLVLRSTNSGMNWVLVHNLNLDRIHNLYFINVNTGFILRYNCFVPSCGTSLYMTTNGGYDWENQINDTSFILRDFSFLNQNTGYIAGSKFSNSYNDNYAKIFITTNSGSTWDTIATGFYCRLRGVHSIDANRLVVFGDVSITNGKSFFLSSNSGQNWISSDIAGNVRCFEPVSSSTYYVINVLYSQNFNLSKSTNFGINWNLMNSSSFFSSIDFITEFQGVGVGVRGLVASTTNSGINWNNQTTRLETDWFWSVDFVNDNTGYAGGGQRLFKTYDGGSSWVLIPGKPGEHMDFVDANTGYVVNIDTLHKTTDGGSTWINLNYGLYGQLNEVHFINPNTGYIIGKYNILKKTTDGGMNWIQITGHGSGYQECMYFYDESLGFIGKENNPGGWGLSRTSNGGASWSFSKFPGVEYFIYDITFLNQSTGFFTTGGKIFKTTNSGNNWYPVFDHEYYLLGDIWAIQFVNTSLGYATLNSGRVLKTTNSGDSWTMLNSISYYGFYDLSFVNESTGYFVGVGGVILKTTNGGGTISVQLISNIIPNEFKLFQNYPNPFNPVTKIRFAIPRTSSNNSVPLRLAIYDALGREIEILVNETLSPGEYEIEWNALNYPSGVYFARLTHSSSAITNKMILLK